MVAITKLQGKQFETNELVNLSLKEFDESMHLINNSKDLFSSEINIANQRLLIYETNIKEMEELGTFIIHISMSKIICFMLVK